MAEFKRPGVYLSESLASPQADVGVSVSNGCFVGAHPRGPLGVTLVTSFQQFTMNYGGFVAGQPASDLLYAVYQFFNNGGRQCYVVRMTDGNEAVASATFLDKEAVGVSPTRPRTTLIISAANPGAWGNALNIAITPSPSDATRFNITVYLGGATDANVVERFANLTMDVTDPRYVEAIVNSTTSGSLYITIADQHVMDATTPAVLADATPAPTGTSPIIPVALTGGLDATGIPSSGRWDTALGLLDAVGDPVNLNLPGITTTTLVNKALAYAVARGDVFVVIDGITTVGDVVPTVSGAVTAAQAYTADDLSVGAVYFPRPVIADPASASAGATKAVPPGGAILGQFAANDAGYGVQKTPAGLSSRIANAVGLEIALTNADLDTLNTSQVNAIRSLPGAGVVVFGGRTLTTTGHADRYISVRRSLIFVKAQLAQLTRFAVFEANYYLTWQQVQNVVDQFLLGFWQTGGLVGSTAAEAFYAICDDTNNTPTSVANGELHLDVGVAVQKPAEFVAIKISQYDGAVSVVEAA